MKNFTRTSLFIFIGALLAGCVSKSPAPVVESRPDAPRPSVPTVTGGELGRPTTPTNPPIAAPSFDPSKVHVVQKGETLISIALARGLDYRELAAWNNITNPNLIRLGEPLRVVPPGREIATAPMPPSFPLPAQGVPPPVIMPDSGALVVATPMIKGDAVIATPLTPAAPPLPDARALGNTAALKIEPKAIKLPYSDKALAQAATEGLAPPPSLGAPVGIVTPGSTSLPPPPLVTPPVVAATSPSGVAVLPALPGANDDPLWGWPLAGKSRVIANYSEANKGIDIPGSKGTAILAAAPGKVIYAGTQIRGYGRLVLVKHNNIWISAYAHNEKIVVNEGDEVKKGQKIAEMGSSDADQVKLHFEIRKQGKPLDPLKFLPAQ